MISVDFEPFLASGLSVLPTNDIKAPDLASWQSLQSRLATKVEIGTWRPSHGVGVICGVISGGVFCIDVDEKNDPTKMLMKEYAALIREQAPELLKRVIIESTPSAGFHVIAKCKTPIRNLKLAKRKDREVLIETRGEGGYFCAAPTPGYKLLQGSFLAVPEITNEDFEILLDCARALNEEADEPPAPTGIPHIAGSGKTPMDDYDARISPNEVACLLEGYGWKKVFQRGQAIYFKRPNKADKGISATYNHIPGRFYVFTTSTQFESEHIYKACAVYTMLEHGGDYKAAAKALAAAGYGEKAKPAEKPPTAIAKPDEMFTRVMDLYDNGMKKGVSPGWESLRDLYQVVKGQLNIFTGIPSHGKSEFTDAMMVNLAEKEGWNFVVHSPENYPVELHVRKLAEKRQRQNMFGGGRMNKDAMATAAKWVLSHFTFLDGVDEDVTLDSIFNAVMEQKYKRPVDGVLIDPWNELESTRPEKMSETDFIGLSLKRSRMFARKNDLWFGIVAHPTKMRKDPKTGDYPIPNLYDISGSAHWYNKADNGFIIHRDFENQVTRVILQKVKFKYYGHPGEVEMKYDLASGRYLDMTAHDHFATPAARQLPPEREIMDD